MPSLQRLLAGDLCTLSDVSMLFSVRGGDIHVLSCLPVSTRGGDLHMLSCLPSTHQQGFKHSYVQDARAHARTHTRTHTHTHTRTYTHTHTHTRTYTHTHTHTHTHTLYSLIRVKEMLPKLNIPSTTYLFIALI